MAIQYTGIIQVQHLQYITSLTIPVVSTIMPPLVDTIWGGQTEWTITSSGTWTVPKTGNYYIELYGGGGSTALRSYYLGGTSCQNYNSIALTQGEDIPVTIGEAGTAYYDQSIGSPVTKDGGDTIFGQYSVNGGKSGTESSGGGQGAGNKGTNGAYNSTYGSKSYSNGILSEKYGWSTNGLPTSYSTAGSGAVYLKYLGE